MIIQWDCEAIIICYMKLNKKEKEILKLYGQDLPLKKIAVRIKDCTLKDVKKFIYKISKKQYLNRIKFKSNMENFNKWREYMSWCNSPDSFIDWGWYYIISASLRRCVWGGPEHKPLYPNQYAILTADPGIGKGLVVTTVSDFLSHWKLDPNQWKTGKQEPKTNEEKLYQHAIEEMHKAEFKQAQHDAEGEVKDKERKHYEKPFLIPIAADATTYEALVTAMPKALRRKDYYRYDSNLGKNVPDIYIHSSLCFCLEEISSLFRKRTEDLVNFLLRVYDCGDYNYETIRRGKDRIRKPCLNFFGGTTPGFMQNVFGDELLNEGFASRTFFIFATKNRRNTLRIPALNPEQLKYRIELLDHIKKLTTLFGPVAYTDEAWAFLEDWWQNIAQHERPNTSVRLNPYYARKNIHVQKLAMAGYFGEYTDGPYLIGVEWFKWALDVLATEEKKMHYCLGLDENSPLANPSRKIEKFLTQNGNSYTKKELLAEFFTMLPGFNPKEALETVLEHLIFTNKIESEEKEHPIIKDKMVFYKAAKKISM